MPDWKPIEEFTNESIWVIKYDMYVTPDGNFTDFSNPAAVKFTDCHGWYKSEDEAQTVLRHFPKPNSYRIEKVNGRRLKQEVD